MATQRFTRNRRPLNAQQQAQPQLVVGQLATINGKTAAFDVDNPMQLDGVPKIRAQITNQFPTAATFNEDGQLVLTYAANLNLAERFEVLSYDMSLRTAQGGYLAPGSIGFYLPPDSNAETVAAAVEAHQAERAALTAAPEDVPAPKRRKNR